MSAGALGYRSGDLIALGEDARSSRSLHPFHTVAHRGPAPPWCPLLPILGEEDHGPAPLGLYEKKYWNIHLVLVFKDFSRVQVSGPLLGPVSCRQLKTPDLPSRPPVTAATVGMHPWNQSWPVGATGRPGLGTREDGPKSKTLEAPRGEEESQTSGPCFVWPSGGFPRWAGLGGEVRGSLPPRGARSASPSVLLRWPRVCNCAWHPAQGACDTCGGSSVPSEV